MGNPLCRYRHVFGKEGEGPHSLRFLNIAFVDVLGTVLFAFIFSYMFHVPVGWMLLFLFVLAIVLHRAFCVNTTVNKAIFGVVQ